jgi:hypothetical protein
VPSPILAFRPATVTARLPARSEACPLSSRDLLRPLVAAGLVLPIVRAPVAGVARGALLAAREAGSALALALPPGVPPEAWFDAVAEAADGVAAGLPVVLCGEVRVDGQGESAVERAFHEAWRLVEAGLTHLAVDIAPVAPAERARAFEDVARAALERGLGVECVLPHDGELPAPSRAAALFDALAKRGVAPDLAGVRLPAPADAAGAREQARRLAELCAALGGVPVIRRGPVNADVLAALAGGPVKGCEDGGAAATDAMEVIPWELLERPDPDAPRASPLERAAAALEPETADRLEARAYVAVQDFVAALGARGSAALVARALARQLEDRP